MKIKKIKVDLSKVQFKDKASRHDYENGKILEDAMIEQGFPIDRTGTVDLPNGIEVKTRSANTKSNHTIGTMTIDKIIKTPWDETTFKQKLQRQYRVTINDDNHFTGKVTAKGEFVDLSAPEIQCHFEDAYEECRRQLTKQIVTGVAITPRQTISGGQYGQLEHKPAKKSLGKSFAWRIPPSGMKKILAKANMLDKGFVFD
jgi:hypothetical protein